MSGAAIGTVDARRSFSTTRWGALALCTGLLVAVVAQPGLAAVLKLEPPGAAGWTLAVGLGVLPLIAGPLVRPRGLPH